MRRVRIALALASLAALALVALLGWRAQQGLAVERALRHEAVAERAFEEMERALTRVLEREEGRAFEAYAFYLPASGERSPLASGLEAFVVGAFQIDPQGEVSTPFEPRDPEVARARGDWPPSAEARAAIGRVRGVVDDLWPPTGADASALAQRAAAPVLVAKSAEHHDASPPGKTRALAGPGVDASDAAKREAQTADAPEARSAYDLLESLNRSADDRAERKQKVERALPSAVYGSSERLAAGASPPHPAEAEAESGAEPDRLALADEVGEATLPEADLDRLGAFGRSEAGLPAPAEPTAPVARDRGALRIALDPMVGVAAGDALVLYRTVLVDRRGWRQGLVLDRATLGAWLEGQVLGESPLAALATLAFDGAPAPLPRGDHYLFAHRFAEPFDALEARLALQALPDLRSSGALYALVAVLLGVGAAGLFAVHRMVSVAVHYAERRSNFAAAVSHELKTPLTAIRMYAEMLRDGLVSGDAKRREYHATITDESERLSRLVDNVLEFSKLEGGRRELAIAVGAVGPVLEEAVAKLSSHAAREGFALSLEVAPDLPALRFDRDALLQVLYNLVDNAMKYAKGAERRTIELAARPDASGEGVCVEVRDFGPGVAKPHLEHVFEPFYRGESELVRSAKGTGIGLALVEELSQRMGAAVHGANAEGGGFRVWLEFRAVRA